MALRLILYAVPLHCGYKMFTLCSISGDHLHLMTIQKIKRMIQTLDQPCSLLQIFSKARLDSSQGVLIILPPAAGCCTLSILTTDQKLEKIFLRKRTWVGARCRRWTLLRPWSLWVPESKIIDQWKFAQHYRKADNAWSKVHKNIGWERRDYQHGLLGCPFLSCSGFA